ncbi:hypothetical protein [Streptomyces sp. CBMA156]|uniref:hypothetical protein n=1 Tax=Streptomyces sp. CBMA156 TaxID=1930280 RepID=UPI0016619497|nr:hypothetical protein [Streptomyces sp. CBMA156]MBD0669440.1 hypothetical protein [Streptomyces sp. CBMA156]
MISRLRKALTAATAVPVLILGAVGTASAQNASVIWSTSSGSYTACLSHLGDAVTLGIPCASGGSGSWRDDNSNLQDPDSNANYYAEKTPGSGGKCLTAFWQGQIYLEPCANPVNYYEQWAEESINGHWHLKNRMTQKCLAHPADLSMKDCDEYDTQQWWY